LYTILTLIKLIKMCFKETYSKLCIDEDLSDAFTVQNVLKQGDGLLPLLFTFISEYAVRKEWN